MEKAVARMLREAGYRVVENQLLRDTNLVAISSTDRRQFEVVAYNGPLFNGQVLCIDATMGSCLDWNGNAHAHSADRDGATFEGVIRRKHATYPELSHSNRGRLIVFGCETGGRWMPQALKFVTQLAKAKARMAPPLLRRSVAQAWHSRWWSMLSVVTQTCFAQSLVDEETDGMHFADGPAPDMGDLLTDGRLLDAPVPSRLPARG